MRPAPDRATARSDGSEDRPAAPASNGLHAGATTIVPFEATPFPYDGLIPEQHVRFLDVERDGRRGHTSPRGGVYWQDQTYSDKHVLLSIPAGLDLDRPVLLVLFLHGNQARLGRDVRDRQRVPQQLAASGLNAVLVAPQFAVDALDSSAGHFWDPGFLTSFLAEAADRLGHLAHDDRARAVFANAPIALVAYSGGYLPAVFALQGGGSDHRLRGVVLLDALYAEEPRMAEWVLRRGNAFFFSAYSPSTKTPNETLEALLKGRNLPVASGMPSILKPGSITFLRTPASVTHNDFVTRAWTVDPMRAVLMRIAGFERGKAGERPPARGAADEAEHASRQPAKETP